MQLTANFVLRGEGGLRAVVGPGRVGTRESEPKPLERDGGLECRVPARNSERREHFFRIRALLHQGGPWGRGAVLGPPLCSIRRVIYLKFLGRHLGGGNSAPGP